MARHLNTIGAKPYPPSRDKEPDVYICDICVRPIGSRDWVAHKNSKKHRALEDDLRHAKDVVDTDSPGTDSDKKATDKEGSDKNSSNKKDNDVSSDQAAPYLQGGEDRTCYGCGEEGHLKRDCPKSARDRTCYGCGRVGHQKRNCPNGGDDICFACGKTGHLRFNCTDHQARQGGGAGQQCFNCLDYGHRRTECTKKRVFKCHNCDEIGHKAKDCSQPKDWSRMQCNNCKLYGHIAKHCKAPGAQKTIVGGSWTDSSAASGAAPVVITNRDDRDNWGDAIVVPGW